jgi:hypothetical protein
VTKLFTPQPQRTLIFDIPLEAANAAFVEQVLLPRAEEVLRSMQQIAGKEITHASL